MAKIKIIRNCPPDNNDLYSDITRFIGNEYEVEEGDFFEQGMVANSKGVYIKKLDLEFYEDEYEIIE